MNKQIMKLDEMKREGESLVSVIKREIEIQTAQIMKWEETIQSLKHLDEKKWYYEESLKLMKQIENMELFLMSPPLWAF